MNDDEKTTNENISSENRLSNFTGILPLSSLLVAALIIFLIYLFFSGGMYRFYASALFLFYALVKRMWISVIMLGVLQTILMIPLRIIRIQKSDNIKEFQKKVNKYKSEGLQLEKIKGDFHFGNKVFLFYILDFTIQLTTFLTIGRLFLTDFYLTYLDPTKLFKFVPYPKYPIEDVFFKIPYPEVTKTTNLGWKAFLIILVVLIFMKIIVEAAKSVIKKSKQTKVSSGDIFSRKNAKYGFVYIFLLLIISWFITSYFPTGLKMSIFSGDVSKPNRTLNTVTATMTFLTLMWFGVQKIIRKGKLAKENRIDQETIDKTQKKMFSQSVFDSTLVGLGAFFITNQIPSAFELSIFALEIISLASPFTLDKAILKYRDKSKVDTVPLVLPVSQEEPQT